MRETQSAYDIPPTASQEATVAPPSRPAGRPDTETEIGEADSPEARLRRLRAWAIAGTTAAVVATAAALVVIAARRPAQAPTGASSDVAARLDGLEARLSGVGLPARELTKLHEGVDGLGARLDRIERRLAALEVLPVAPLEKKSAAAEKKKAIVADDSKVAKSDPPEKVKVGKTDPPTKAAAGDSRPDEAAARLAAALGPGDPLESVQDLPAALAAYRDLAAAAERSPPSGETCLLMAYAANAAGRPLEALDWAAKAREALPANRTAQRTGALKAAAVAAFRAGRWETAEAAARAAHDVEPRWAAGWTARVRSLLALKRVEPAETAAREAIERSTAVGSAQLDLAWVQLARAEAAKASLDAAAVAGAADAAKAALNASKSESGGREWPVALGLAQLAAGAPAEAAAALRTAAGRRGDSAAVRYLLGTALAAASDVDGAVEALKAAADLARRSSNDDTRDPLPVMPADWPTDPRRQGAHAAYRSGMICFAAGRYGPAEEQFRSAYLQRGDFAAAYEGAAEALLKLGRPADALDVVAEAVELAPKSGRAHLLRAAALAEAAAAKRRPVDVNLVFESLRKAVEIDPALKTEARAHPSLEPLLKDKRIGQLLSAEPAP